MTVTETVKEALSLEVEPCEYPALNCPVQPDYDLLPYFWSPRWGHLSYTDIHLRSCARLARSYVRSQTPATIPR